MRITFEPGVLRIISLLFKHSDSPKAYYTIWRFSEYSAAITAMGYLKESNEFDALPIKIGWRTVHRLALRYFITTKHFFHSDEYLDFLENHTGNHGIPTIEAIQKSSSVFSGRIWMGEQYVGEPCLINVWATFEVDLNKDLSSSSPHQNFF